MKLVLTFIFLIVLSCPILACEWENVYLVDLAECEALGKVLGTEYQCMDVTSKGYKLYNRGREEDPLYLTKRDTQFIVMKIEGRDTLTVLKGEIR